MSDDASTSAGKAGKKGQTTDNAERQDTHRRKERSHHHPITIREMELEDLSAIFALGERLFTADLWPNLYRTWDEYELVQTFASDNETCLVAEMDDRVVGFALGTLIDKRRSAWTYGYLVWLGVDPTLARQGVGKKLLNRLTEIFIGLGARIMLVDTDAQNTAAVNFFHRHGFGNDTQHVYMTKNLTNHPEYLRRKAREKAQSAAQRTDPAIRTPTPGPQPGSAVPDNLDERA